MKAKQILEVTKNIKMIPETANLHLKSLKIMKITGRI